MPTWSGVEAARVEELQIEVDVHVAEEHENVGCPLPRVSADVQAATSGELLIHRDQGVVCKVLLTERAQVNFKQQRQCTVLHSNMPLVLCAVSVLKVFSRY